MAAAKAASKVVPLRQPLIAVVGATGTGKSQLAVDLALRFNGEIINGDAMQLYRGLPILTNKVTLEEQKGVPHHLLGTIGLDEPTWTVSEFVQGATKVIDEIHAKSKVPIVVGGTHYYTQALLFQNIINEGSENPQAIGEGQSFKILNQPTEVVLAKLREVDPTMAERWHPNDHRKIRRSLEIWLQTGRPASEIYAEQRRVQTSSIEDEVSDTEPNNANAFLSLKYPVLMFWVNVPFPILRDRLNDRVDNMLTLGLLEEVDELNMQLSALKTSGAEVDDTKGIWVSIGFSQFLPVLSALASPTSTPKDINLAKADSTERTKGATRRYAKSQAKWIEIKLAHAVRAANAEDHLFVLDGSDLGMWDANVLEPASRIVGQYLRNDPLPDPGSLFTGAADLLRPRKADKSDQPETWTSQHCDACDVTVTSERDWESHVRGKLHKKVMRGRYNWEHRLS